MYKLAYRKFEKRWAGIFQFTQMQVNSMTNLISAEIS